MCTYHSYVLRVSEYKGFVVVEVEDLVGFMNRTLRIHSGKQAYPNSDVKLLSKRGQQYARC